MLEQKNVLIELEEKWSQWFSHKKGVVEQGYWVKAWELKLKGRNLWDSSEQDGWASYWKTLREEKPGKKLKRKDCKKKEH